MKFETVQLHFWSDVFGLTDCPESRNFSTVVTWRNDFFSLSLWNFANGRKNRQEGILIQISSLGPGSAVKNLAKKIGRRSEPSGSLGPFPFTSPPQCLLRSLIFFRYFTPLLAFSPTIEPGLGLHKSPTSIRWLEAGCRLKLSKS